MFLVAATTEPLTVNRRQRQCRLPIPTICAVVLGITRSLVEMHVSGAVNHPDQKGLQKLSIMEILQHDPHDLPKVQKLSAVTFLRLLSLLSALPLVWIFDGCSLRL